ncbi:MAG: APC family permease, partial [Anaerovorax sp.]
MRQKREYSLFTAIAMILGIVIGSGIFFKSDDMLSSTQGNVGLAAVIFCIAAFTIVFGSLCFSKLASFTDKPGGIVTYANEFIGKRYAIAFGWFQTFIYYPTLVVLISWVVGVYFGLLFNLELTFNGQLVVGIIWFFICFGYNIASAKIGGKFQEVTVVIKLIPLFIIGVAGLIFGDPVSAVMNPTPDAIAATTTLAWISAIGPVAFSFDGWVVSMAVAHEVKDSKRNMPKALIIAPLFVLAAYLIYFLGICGYVGPETVMKLGDGSVTFVAEHLLGSTFANMITAFVTISVMGTVNGVVLGFIRIPYSLALRNAIPGANKLKVLNEKSKMPVNSAKFAMIVCCVWWLIHFLQNKYQLLLNGDISEIAISMSYMLYVPLYFQLF